MLASGNSKDLCTEQKQNNCSQPKSCAGRNDPCTEQRKYLTPMRCCSVFLYVSTFLQVYLNCQVIEPVQRVSNYTKQCSCSAFKMHHSVCEICIGVGYQVVQEILASAASNEFCTEQKQCNCSQQIIIACIEE